MAANSEALKIIDSLQVLRNGIANQEQAAMLSALQLCQKLRTELETPGEALNRMYWGERTLYWVLFVAQDLGIFKTLSRDNDSPKTVDQIAASAGAEGLLTGRILRHMAAMGIVEEVTTDTFAHTELSRYLSSDDGDAWLTFSTYLEDTYAKAPDSLARLKYISPTDPNASTMAHVKGYTGKPFFAVLSQQPKYATAFGKMMRVQSEGRPSWSSGHLYPVQEKLTSVQNADDVLIVDVGGGNGHDLEWFHENHPDIKGRLILQDLPYVVENLKLDGIEPMAHDFYKDQPVKGAQVYFFHKVLHDYDDETCLKILRKIVPAMKPGYSKLLLNELIVPDQGAHWYVTSLDLVMMLTVSARERTRAQMIELIEKVGGGLRVEKVWVPLGDGKLDSLVECVVDAP